MTALTGEDLLGWLDDTTRRWMELVDSHAEVLAFPCDVRETQNVGQLLQHVVAVELRYAERLADRPATDYDNIPYDSGAAIGAVHAQAMERVRQLLARDDEFWDGETQFPTRSAGAMQASRRTILVHLAMHSIRHYAQLATLVRQHGVKPDWFMDYLFQSARAAS